MKKKENNNDNIDVIEKLKELKEQPQSLQEKEENKKPNKTESSLFDFHFPAEEPIMESNISNNEEYIYQDQLNTILCMGFNDVDQIRNLLNGNKGDVNVVINQLFA